MFTSAHEYLIVLLVYIDWTKLGRTWACHAEFGPATAQYTHVSTILKVLSFTFNTVNNLCLQAITSI